MNYLVHNKYLFIFILVVGIFFLPVFTRGKIPLPSDALVGLYHPWRDSLVSQYPNGFPYKNPLITDPVRQQYPYRIAAMEALKSGRLPLWNAYSFSGTPLLANIQSATFYPLNIVFLLFPDTVAWSLLVILQPLLAGFFLYAYLKHFSLGERACFLGAITFAFSGFMVSWLEWNTLDHVALWLPLILLCIEKLLQKISLKWSVVLIFATSSMIFAGHLQTMLYVLFFSVCYFIARLSMQKELFKKSKRNIPNIIHKISPFLIVIALVGIVTSIQTIPTARFVFNSARSFDLPDWQRPDWFIPWQNLIQFIAPDFFGNPATGNYYGVWNYAEFVGYVALLPLLMAAFALFARRDKKTLFYGGMLVLCTALAVSNPLSQLPYRLQIPFISTLQPSRIIFLVDFCLAVLAAFGLDYLVKPEESRAGRVRRVLIFSLLIICGVWVLVLFSTKLGISSQLLDQAIARRNLALPSGLFFLVAFGVLGMSRFGIKKILLTRICIVILFLATIFDFYRFFNKFTPFTDASLVFPETKTTQFLQENLGFYRIITTDRRILPPNVSLPYKIASVDGYDPLYLHRYGELVAVWTRNKADLSPAQFNRILTPQNITSPFLNLMSVKYIVTFDTLTAPQFRLVFSEGLTHIYENMYALPRVFLAQSVETVPDKIVRIEKLLSGSTQLQNTAYVEKYTEASEAPLDTNETVELVSINASGMSISTTTNTSRLVVVTNPYDSAWRVSIDGKEADLLEVNYFLMGVLVPAGTHTVRFSYPL